MTIKSRKQAEEMLKAESRLIEMGVLSPQPRSLWGEGFWERQTLRSDQEAWKDFRRAWESEQKELHPKVWPVTLAVIIVKYRIRMVWFDLSVWTERFRRKSLTE